MCGVCRSFEFGDRRSVVVYSEVRRTVRSLPIGIPLVRDPLVC